ncbi:hypothetical protein KFL_005640050 [Klebsormidium nitens]|uniref:rRNA methyltransferase 1, mitochondrial n=1 Tax=Klebsormidium nitens TaxID=105231 RepID=A0A1Y1IG40_KLENI|nr:hypothetical protein KFL_005640050 [Klebsormidium nitens]|eukprot:GAQ89804.1 hypothetical protein KFL_005640050 [Klebsormidium nitens]
MAPLAAQTAERSILKRVPFLQLPQVLPIGSSSWTVRRTLGSKSGSGARGAGKSLWLEDADPQENEQQGQDQRRGAGGGWNDNGRSGAYSERPTRRTNNDWNADGGARSFRTYGAEKDLNTGSRPPRKEYIDEWGQVDDRETAPGPSDRTGGRASTSYNRSSDSRGGGARRRSQTAEWDGEWGEYLDKVERRRPAGKQGQEEMEDYMAEEGYTRQRRDFASEPGAPMWDDADGGGGGGGNQYGRRPAGQQGGRDRMRPGISKYNERGRRGGEQRSASSRRDVSGGGGGAASRSQGQYAEPERQAWGGENEWGRQDYRRGRGRPGEEEEVGPLVRGGIELSGEVLYGVAPVHAAIRAGRRELFTLYVQENLRPRKKGDKAAVERIKQEAQAAGAALREASKHTLNLLADNRPHQGLVLDAAPLGFTGLDELPPPPAEAAPSAAAPVWVALDEVVDPQNFGAVLRSAYFLGAAGVLTCARNSSPLTAVVSKASAGAAEALEVFSCDNMPTTLELAVQDGWRVLGASADPDAPLITELPKGVPSIIVLGNEGVGLRTNVRRACSGFVRIAGKGTAFPILDASVQNDRDEVDVVQGEGDDDGDGSDDEGIHERLADRRGDVVVDSLNVSVAAGILLHELLAPRPLASVQSKVGAGAQVEETKQPDDVLAQLLSSQSS